MLTRTGIDREPVDIDAVVDRGGVVQIRVSIRVAYRHIRGGAVVALVNGNDPIGREAVEAYEQALERLNPGEREAIIARVELGYSYDELAVMLDKPTGDAARKAAERALVRLAEEMKRGRE